MSDKKTFFNSLEPKSAAIVGGVTGVLVLCTVGFFVLGIMYLKGVRPTGSVATVASNEQGVNNAAQNVDTTLPPVQKSNKPKVELFVMSYCPYGLQMEKAFLPAMELLKDKADMDIKFVSYAMHGLKELDENTRQYCVKKEQNSRFIAYMKCFIGKDDYAACLSEVGVNARKLNLCVDKINKQYGIIEKYNDKSTWLSGQYPVYPIDEALNQQYGVQGSPALVINGQEAQVNRSPEAVKQAICAAFNNPPPECQQSLSNAQPAPGFGAGVASGNTAADCGG